MTDATNAAAPPVDDDPTTYVDDPAPAEEAPEVEAVIEGAHYRRVMGHFATGVTVIAAVDDEGPVGLTAQSLVALSLEPALVAFCPAKTSTSWPRIRAAGAFCANILAEDQEDVCRVFATKGIDKFAEVSWRPGSTGSPVLEGALAWADCRIEAEHDGGDHVVVVGRVVELEVGAEKGPLLFYRGAYGRFEP